MIIKFTMAQEKKLVDWARGLTTAEITEDCLPSGYSLEIEFAPPFGERAMAKKGSSTLDLGYVEVILEGHD